MLDIQRENKRKRGEDVKFASNQITQNMNINNVYPSANLDCSEQNISIARSPSTNTLRKNEINASGKKSSRTQLGATQSYYGATKVKSI